MYTIMIVEDDRTIADVLKRQLTKWGYEVYAAEAFDTVLEQFKELRPDLVLLDISLPYYNGFYWCQEIRKVSKTPIIFISSQGDDMNLVMAINMGGDDFIPKPFTMEVVTAKIQALLRRTYSFQTEAEVLKSHGVTLSLADGSLMYQGKTLPLTKNEYRIMKLLMKQKGSIVSREELMNELWDTENFVDDNTLTVNVTRLRKKLGELGVTDMIETKKSMGYLIPKEE